MYFSIGGSAIGARVSRRGSETQKSTRNRRNEREVLSKDNAESKKKRKVKERERERERSHFNVPTDLRS